MTDNPRATRLWNEMRTLAETLPPDVRRVIANVPPSAGMSVPVQALFCAALCMIFRRDDLLRFWQWTALFLWFTTMGLLWWILR